MSTDPTKTITAPFEKRFTTMIDCCPIWVAEPTDPFWADLPFQGKYGGSCFKNSDRNQLVRMDRAIYWFACGNQD
jgi:hypothetical protein